MRIEQLEYVVAVTRHGSLRKASEKLHISQPALSEAVSKLERELGVPLLDRRRAGARISRRGRDLLQGMADVLEAVDRLRAAAGDPAAGARVLRIGTVSAATSTLLAPAVHDVRAAGAGTVEVLNCQQPQIFEGLAEGSLDLGLVNLLEGDDLPTDLRGTVLVRGRAVVALPAGHPLAERDEVEVDRLRDEPFVAMRSGYLMHRFAHRMFGARMPHVACTTDGAELGKVMVAEGLGVTVLPDYSVVDDPLHRAGLITLRPIAGDRTPIALVACQRRGERAPEQLRTLVAALDARARAYREGVSPS